MVRKILKEYLKEHKVIVAIFLGTIIAEIVLTVLIPSWRGYFYGIVEAKQAGQVLHACLLFVGLIGGLVVLQSLKTWLKAIMGLSLREIITLMLLNKWNSASTLTKESLSFPDQRINEDAKLCTVLSLGVASELFISGGIVLYLVLTLQNLSLIAYATLYTVVVSIVALLMHKPLVKADINLQIAEADQRFTLSKMVMGHGQETLHEKFQSITGKYRQYVGLLLGYNIFNGLQNNLSILVPFLILLPTYFTGDITFGILMRDIASFELIVINSTILLNLYPQVINMNAAWTRVRTFYEA